MRLKKSILNSSVGMISFIISFLPMFIVRKVFIENLGAELLGLTSLYTNIVGYLSIVELGVGGAIIYSLYKPFAENDKNKVAAYIQYYKKFYISIGIIIMCLGILITPFLKNFIKGNIDGNLINIGFILFLINTVIGYLFTYKHCILNVAQETFKLSIAVTIAKCLIAIGQVILLKLGFNIYAYIVIQIIVNLLMYIFLEFYINKKFFWINQKNVKLEKESEIDLKKNIKSIFCHKIGGVVVFGTDNIVVSKFIDLIAVTKYNNYTLITNAFSMVLGQAMSGITASIGNLLVEKDNEYAYKIHRKLFFVNFWSASFIVITLANTLSHFIGIWVGEEFILDKLTIFLLLANLYIQLMRGQVEQFKHASGEYYKDRYAPLIEAGINLIMSIILVNIIGLPGVFLGTLISNLAVIFWVQPKIVYKYVFKKRLKIYFLEYFRYLAIAIVPMIITMYLTRTLKYTYEIDAFIINCVINIVVVNSFYLIIFWKNEKLIYFKNILTNMILKLNNKERENV